MISETAARRIAGDWHGGQMSPLYAFCSSGTIVAGIIEEIDSCLHNTEHVGADDIDELVGLRSFVEMKGVPESD